MELLMTADRQQGEKWAIFGNFEIGKLSFAKYDICQIWYTKNIIYANTRQNSQNWIKQAKTSWKKYTTAGGGGGDKYQLWKYA